MLSKQLTPDYRATPSSLQKAITKNKVEALAPADKVRYNWRISDGEWVYVPTDAKGVPFNDKGKPVIPAGMNDPLPYSDEKRPPLEEDEFQYVDPRG